MGSRSVRDRLTTKDKTESSQILRHGKGRRYGSGVDCATILRSGRSKDATVSIVLAMMTTSCTMLIFSREISALLSCNWNKKHAIPIYRLCYLFRLCCIDSEVKSEV